MYKHDFTTYAGFKLLKAKLSRDTHPNHRHSFTVSQETNPLY